MRCKSGPREALEWLGICGLWRELSAALSAVSRRVFDFASQLHGKTGIDDVVDLLRERIYDKIGRTYRDLEVECTRQLFERLLRVR
jgi:hypothetical protein